MVWVDWVDFILILIKLVRGKKSQRVVGLYPPGILRQCYCCRTHNSDYDPISEYSNEQQY